MSCSTSSSTPRVSGRRERFLQVLAWWFLFCATAGASSDGESRRYFAVKMKDKLIGVAWNESHVRQRDGVKVRELRSHTELKVALLGKTRNVVLDATTVLDDATGAPIRYEYRNRTNDETNHVDVEFSGREAVIYAYHAGEDRGSPSRLELPEGTQVLGGNIFGHWDLILAAAHQSGQAKAKVPVVVPEVREVETLEFERGEQQTTTVGGREVEAIPWRLLPADVVAWSHPETHQMLKLELPSQETVIELSDPSVVKLYEKSQAEEVLARHFKQSNVRFDDFLAVRFFRAEVDVKVIGSGVVNPPSVLTTVMQQFDGTKEGSEIRGVVTVRTLPYDRSQSPSFPSTPAAEFSQWLKPEAYIESDDAVLRGKAEELTANCKTRWQAVENVGKWVHKNIRYAIADTPSARRAFDKKVGDCGPHATLMVAMLRAVGVPARLVGGVMYTPSFGGSFGQHAWVEVQMGDAGWLPMDPTTGEFHQLSATHIKFFEGMGGVVPHEIDVLEFKPPNRSVQARPPGKARKIPFEFGRPYEFVYRQGGEKLGVERFQFSARQHDGEEAIVLKSEIELVVNRVIRIAGTAELVARPSGLPVSFERRLTSGKEVHIQCELQRGKVLEKISGGQSLEREIELPAEGCFCFDNNMTASFALICSQLSFEKDKPLRLEAFHPSSLQVLALTVKPMGREMIEVEGEKLDCWRCDVAPLNNTFWITTEGLLVRVQQGTLQVELRRSTDAAPDGSHE